MRVGREVRAQDEDAEDRPCRSALVYSWVTRVGSSQSRACVSLTREGLPSTVYPRTNIASISSYPAAYNVDFLRNTFFYRLSIASALCLPVKIRPR